MSASNQIMFLNILYPEFLQKVAAHWFLNKTIDIKKKKKGGLKVPGSLFIARK